MPLNDKSFQTLVISLVLHGLLLLVLRSYQTPPWTSSQAETTEITIVDTPKEKPKTVVTELNRKDLLEKFKDQADFLSQFTARVKEQLRARKVGETRNANNPTPPRKAEPITPGESAAKSSQNFTRNIAMGESTLSEKIPGVKEGAFTSLNTDQFTYYTFFARINEQVRHRWISQIRQYLNSLTQKDFSEISKRERVTRIEIVLDRTGGIVDAIVHFTSGYKALDQAAAKAFINAAPLMNPPQGMVEADGKVRLFYEFYVTLNPNPFVGSQNN